MTTIWVDLPSIRYKSNWKSLEKIQESNEAVVCKRFEMYESENGRRKGWIFWEALDQLRQERIDMGMQF